jgi:hypothetical protein
VANEIIRATRFGTWTLRMYWCCGEELADAYFGGAPDLAAGPPGYLLPMALGQLYHYILLLHTHIYYLMARAWGYLTSLPYLLLAA